MRNLENRSRLVGKNLSLVKEHGNETNFFHTLRSILGVFQWLTHNLSAGWPLLMYSKCHFILVLKIHKKTNKQIYEIYIFHLQKLTLILSLRSHETPYLDNYAYTKTYDESNDIYCRLQNAKGGGVESNTSIVLRIDQIGALIDFMRNMRHRCTFATKYHNNWFSWDKELLVL